MSIRHHRSRALLVTMLSVLPFPMADWFLSRFTAAWAAEDAARTELETVKRFAREAAAESAALRRAMADGGHAAHAAGQGELANVLFGALKFDDSHGRRLLEEMTEILAARNSAEARADEYRARHTKLWDDVCDALAAGEHEEPVVAAKRVMAELAAVLTADDASATITVQRDRARAGEEKLRSWIEAHAASLDDDALEDQAREVRAFLESVDAQGRLLLEELVSSRRRTNDAEVALGEPRQRIAEAENRAETLKDDVKGEALPTRAQIIEKAAVAFVADQSRSWEAIQRAIDNALELAHHRVSFRDEVDEVIEKTMKPEVYFGEMGREVEYRLKAKV